MTPGAEVRRECHAHQGDGAEEETLEDLSGGMQGEPSAGEELGEPCEGQDEGEVEEHLLEEGHDRLLYYKHSPVVGY